MEFKITAIYARCNAMERLELWEELEDIADHTQIPWIIGGDCNVILTEEEKQGGSSFTNAESVEFTNCIAKCALLELKFTGSTYTWWNGRIEEECIFKRLDRVLVNQEFLDVLPSSIIHHLVRQGSDNAPLHVICNSREDPVMKPFKFLIFGPSIINLWRWSRITGMWNLLGSFCVI